MSGCLGTTTLGAQWFYPVIDPYRTAGPESSGFSQAYGYAFAWDAVAVRVARNPALSRCQMRVELSVSMTAAGTPVPLAEIKQIQAFNYFNNAWSGHIESDPTGAVTAMTIGRRKPGESCSLGTDTVVLARADTFGPKAFYAFPSDDFWDFWGGCTVTFQWVKDADYFHGAAPFAPSGAQTPAPRYPLVGLPDRTLMRNEAVPGFRVVFGGTDFRVDDSLVINGIRYLDAFDPIAAVASRSLPALPVDGTLVREWNRPEVYVVYGGAKFHIPDPATLFALGFDWPQVGVIPPNGTGKLLQTPSDGTLIKEQHDPRVFLVDGRKLRWVKSPAVMDARCLPWRHVRTVPDTALSTVPHGPDLDLP
ncbi:MAG: hypothetical protein ACXVHB_18485 [Solirubrobacteraceae bacterium]